MALAAGFGEILLHRSRQDLDIEAGFARLHRG